MLPQSTRARYRLALVTAGLLAVGWLVWSARGALYPFIAGAIFAFVLAPIVDWVASLMSFRRTRPGLAIGLAVTYVYAMAVLTLVLISVFLGPRITAQGRDLAGDIPELVAVAREQFERSSDWYREHVPVNVQRQVDQTSQDLGRRAGNIGVAVVERTIGFLTGGVSNILAYIVVPFWLFYVLKDREQGARTFYSLFPHAIRGDVRVMMHEANRVLGSFIRAQLALSAFSGIVTAIGLTVFGIKFSLILGVITGVANLIPVLGPMIGGLPVLLVTAATRPGWMVLWVFLFLFISQNLKDYILVPRIQGQAVNIHPAVILVLLVIAGHVAGFWGLLLAVPVAAVVRDVFLYVYRRLEDDDQSLAASPVAGKNGTADSGVAVPDALTPGSLTNRPLTVTPAIVPRGAVAPPDTASSPS